MCVLLYNLGQYRLLSRVCTVRFILVACAVSHETDIDHMIQMVLPCFKTNSQRKALYATTQTMNVNVFSRFKGPMLYNIPFTNVYSQ